jgi:sulfatase maturation enzyme AslB (radical SAM superfamily)
MLPFWAEHLCFHSPTSKTSNFKHEYGSFLPKSAFLTQIHSKAIFKTERLWFRTAQICLLLDNLLKLHSLQLLQQWSDRMYHQIEVTTRCNFSCWYCAGRDMPQKDMAWDTFTSIVDAIAQSGSTVSLQGEGEPTLHPRFWEMVRYVRTKGHVPYTIINGSRVNATLIARHFMTVGISIDTLDSETAERIGRHNLTKVLAGVKSLRKLMAPHRITIMTVDLGQPLEGLRDWVKAQGFGRHIVQPLMQKQDYAQRYSQVARQTTKDTNGQTCRFVEQDTMRFYTWQGQVLPCCFIKDTSGLTSIGALRASLHAGNVPAGCAGCKELCAVAPLPINDQLEGVVNEI